MNFRSLSILVLLLVFVTAVACSFAENFLPEMEPSYEVWAVDQSSTVSDGTGGLVYIWDGKDIFLKGAKNATPEIIDLAKAAKDANCNAPKKATYDTFQLYHPEGQPRHSGQCRFW